MKDIFPHHIGHHVCDQKVLVYVTIQSFKVVFICKKLENHPCACPYMPTFALQLHTQPYEAKKLTKDFF